MKLFILTKLVTLLAYISETQTNWTWAFRLQMRFEKQLQRQLLRHSIQRGVESALKPGFQAWRPVHEMSEWEKTRGLI